MLANQQLKTLLLAVFVVSQVDGWLWSSSKVVEPEVTPSPPLAQHHDHKLSDQDHFVDSDNDNKFEHNLDYDHEAFLGKEEAEKFKTFHPEESKKRLGKIIDEMDTDKDDGVTLEELKEWISKVERRRLSADVDERWKTHEEDDTVELYLEKNYGQLNQWSEEEKEAKKEEYKTYQKMMKRDEKKFKAADQDKDGKLNKKEYADFVHPEESLVMRDIVISESLEDMDKNGDGVVSVEEFLGELWDGVGPEPDWVKQEREHFKHVRDLNKDSVLDREELASWILPMDFDRSLREAQHLVFEADTDKDGKLSREEILANYSVFVASTATNYGEDLHEDL